MGSLSGLVHGLVHGVEAPFQFMWKNSGWFMPIGLVAGLAGSFFLGPAALVLVPVFASALANYTLNALIDSMNHRAFTRRQKVLSIAVGAVLGAVLGGGSAIWAFKTPVPSLAAAAMSEQVGTAAAFGGTIGVSFTPFSAMVTYPAFPAPLLPDYAVCSKEAHRVEKQLEGQQAISGVVTLDHGKVLIGASRFEVTNEPWKRMLARLVGHDVKLWARIGPRHQIEVYSIYGSHRGTAVSIFGVDGSKVFVASNALDVAPDGGAAVSLTTASYRRPDNSIPVAAASVSIDGVSLSGIHGPASGLGAPSQTLGVCGGLWGHRDTSPATK